MTQKVVDKLGKISCSCKIPFHTANHVFSKNLSDNFFTWFEMSETWHGILLGHLHCWEILPELQSPLFWLIICLGWLFNIFLFFDPSDISKSLHIFGFVVEYCLVKVNILSTYFLLLKGQNAYYLKKTRHTPLSFLAKGKRAFSGNK